MYCMPSVLIIAVIHIFSLYLHVGIPVAYFAYYCSGVRIANGGWFFVFNINICQRMSTN